MGNDRRRAITYHAPDRTMPADLPPAGTQKTTMSHSETPPDLKPMRKWDVKPVKAVQIEIANPEHFQRTMQFASDNMLSVEFAKCFEHLMHLLAQTGGTIWPDSLTAPSFIWRACGMTGGFIFHERSREWSLHT
jgi:hypothetical protein